MDNPLTDLQHLINLEFGDIVRSFDLKRNKLRIFIIDDTYLDIFNSNNIRNRWAFHWECRHITNEIHRHDNIPHQKWSNIKTFPWHYHQRLEINVIESEFTDDHLVNCRKMMKFIMDSINKVKKSI